MTVESVSGTTQKTRWLVIAIIAVTAMTSCHYWRKHVLSDANQMRIFREHKTQYETLLSMLQHDRVITFINSELSTPADPTQDGISPERMKDYRRYMSEIDCAGIVYESSLGSVLFINDGMGAPNILYFPVESIAPTRRRNRELGLPDSETPLQSHPIDGNWYLSSPAF